jgi:hypothetical protein
MPKPGRFSAFWRQKSWVIQEFRSKRYLGLGILLFAGHPSVERTYLVCNVSGNQEMVGGTAKAIKQERPLCLHNVSLITVSPNTSNVVTLGD